MRTDKLVALCTVSVVVAAGLAAALMVGRQDGSQAVVAGVGSVNTPGDQNQVVTAPPLMAPVSPALRNSTVAGSRGTAHAMGAAPGCRNCGVVQLVVAVYERGEARPDGYQMHIRMDDGTVRTVQQRGALAAGSRVMLEGDTVHVLAEQPRAG
jgi:hypothetical protein